MNTASYLELYLDVFGWLMFDQIWDILTATGLAYLPFIGMLLRNIVHPMYRQDAKDASHSSLRTIELDLFCMLTVVVLATQPIMTLDFNALSYTKACKATATRVSPGNTGTTYDQTFTAVALGGHTAKVPVWWYGVLALTAGFDDAVIAAIPCSADIRLLTYGIQNARVKDPALRRQLQLFINDCYSYAMSRYLETTGIAADPLDDLYWLGSSQFIRDFYNQQRASEIIPGFNYQSSRDLEYDPAIEIPAYGKPTCNEWWSGSNASNPNYGLRQALLNQVDQNALANFKATTAALTDKQANELEDIVLKTLVAREKSYFNGLHDLQGYNDRAVDVLNSAAGTAGSLLESWSFYPKMYMVKLAAPILQASALMLLFALLPFVILLSSYDIGVMIFMSVVIFSVKFWSVLWAIAHWLDNHLLTALEPESWYQLDVANNLVAEMMINFVTGLLFIGLPLFWSGVLGWVGIKVGGEISTMNNFILNQSSSAGARGSQALQQLAGNSLKK